ncbi:hemin transporter [Streptomyces sp. SKN60]|uniref:globin domain-containing protein n=1 Tax=Streptomyces sp. SKN60 TaxID=2855506 RepID=UPI002246E574|nr:globin domain-containing protein [Streptomyces sp. SKN60]MCX2180508.1 hemin transporter [Streptomyces sp. SKN60]
MLSEQSVPVVRATLPAVGGALDEITERFYAGMFAAHPELLRDLFNRGNQATGDQRKALAGSIAAFAGALLEHPDSRPDVMLSRIAHKHASLGVTSEQYKIVHEHLFAAIVAVLGDAVTPEVAQAWDEVYWLMANALIALEARLYEGRGVAEGEVWHPMEIAGRDEETADTVSFTLRHPDGRPTADFRPGQYMSVQVTLPDGARQIRQYSLSTAPGRPDWRITVKRVDGDPAGEVSSWLHAHGTVGDRVAVSEPFGDLVLPEGDGPLLLASAGIGSTPMLAMLDHLVATGSTRPVTVVHADRSPAGHAHREELRRLVDALPQGSLHLWYEEPGAADARLGRADVTALDLPEGVTAYLCGPLPFMRAVRGDLLGRGVAAADVHYEVFGPDLWLGAAA